MYKFLITLDLKPGTRDTILAAAPPVQAATRAEPGCIAYDFYACTDNPDRLVFIECFTSKEAHQQHCEHPYTREFIALHEPLHVAMGFELIDAEAAE